jgi:hypothetical protein
MAALMDLLTTGPGYATGVLDEVGGVDGLAAMTPAEMEASDSTYRARQRLAAALELGRRLARATAVGPRAADTNHRFLRLVRRMYEDDGDLVRTVLLLDRHARLLGHRRLEDLDGMPRRAAEAEVVAAAQRVGAPLLVPLYLSPRERLDGHRGLDFHVEQGRAHLDLEEPADMARLATAPWLPTDAHGQGNGEGLRRVPLNELGRYVLGPLGFRRRTPPADDDANGAVLTNTKGDER